MRRVAGLLLGIALLSPACSDTTAPPQPGELSLRFTSPHTTDAAAIVTLTVPAGVTIAEVTAVDEDVAVFHRASGTTVRIAVFGPLASGALARFMVPNVRDAGRYSVQLVEVADETNALRASLAGYTVTVVQE